MSVNTEFLYFSPLLAGYTLYYSRCRLRVFVSRLTSIEYSEQGSLDTLRCYILLLVSLFSRRGLQFADFDRRRTASNFHGVEVVD